MAWWSKHLRNYYPTKAGRLVYARRDVEQRVNGRAYDIQKGLSNFSKLRILTEKEINNAQREFQFSSNEGKLMEDLAKLVALRRERMARFDALAKQQMEEITIVRIAHDELLVELRALHGLGIKKYGDKFGRWFRGSQWKKQISASIESLSSILTNINNLRKGIKEQLLPLLKDEIKAVEQEKQKLKELNELFSREHGAIDGETKMEARIDKLCESDEQDIKKQIEDIKAQLIEGASRSP